MQNIDKLINEYNKRVFDLDKQIHQLTQKIRAVRMKSGSLTAEYWNQTEEHRNDRTTATAKRQLIIQFIQDLKSIQSGQATK